MTDEHVWPRWLRETSGGKSLLQASHGERMPNKKLVTSVAEDGTYVNQPVDMGHWSRDLPHVVVKVCAICNNGWMSALEAKVRGTLRPLLIGKSPVELRPADQELLATWATKTFMTYALTHPRQSNPFTPEEYKQLATTGQIPQGVQVWASTVKSVYAEVAIVLNSWALYGADFRPDYDPDNAAVGLLAASGLVLFIAKMPNQLGEMARVLHPPFGDQPAVVHRISRAMEGIVLQEPVLGEDYMESAREWLRGYQAVGMPIPNGLTAADIRQGHELYMSGIPIDAVRKLMVPPPAAHDDESFAREARDDVEKSYREASTAIHLGHFDVAVTVLKSAARTHLLQKDFRGAARLLLMATEVQGGGAENDPQVAYSLGECYLKLQDPQAVPWYLRAIDLGLAGNEVRFGIVDSHTFQGQYREARDELLRMSPENPHEEATILVAGGALSYLIEELGIEEQDRKPLDEESIPSLDQEGLKETMKGSDAISRLLWQRIEGDEEIVEYYYARAWFGEAPHVWLMVAGLLQHYCTKEVVQAFVRLGLKKMPVLYLIGEEVLTVMEGLEHVSVPDLREAIEQTRLKPVVLEPRLE